MKTVQLSKKNVQTMRSINALFGQVFDDEESYSSKKPSTHYLESLLSSPSFIALAVLDGETVVGALVAYELIKFEQERSEIYIYDLAVASTHRRVGVATTLIETLRQIATERGACVIFVQADKGDEDKPAIELYSKLGHIEDVFHFDISVPVKPN